MIANAIIIKPIITEKSMQNTEKHIFSFVVSSKATKESVKNAVEKLFNVHVVRVATSVLKGGSVRTGAKRIAITKQSVKKAFVTLKAGEKISLFELGE